MLFFSVCGRTLFINELKTETNKEIPLDYKSQENIFTEKCVCFSDPLAKSLNNAHYCIQQKHDSLLCSGLFHL